MDMATTFGSIACTDSADFPSSLSRKPHPKDAKLMKTLNSMI